MPSNHLVCGLVIRFVACAPWNMSLCTFIELLLILSNVLIIFCPFSIKLFILIVKFLVVLSISLIVKIVNFGFMVNLREIISCIKSVGSFGALGWYKAGALTTGGSAEVGSCGGGLLVEIL